MAFVQSNGWNCSLGVGATVEGDQSGATAEAEAEERERRLTLSSFALVGRRLRQRDERKRVLKLSLAKLRRIDDAESCLRRSVLLNNTLRRLQRDARDEKQQAAAHAAADRKSGV